VGGAKGHLDRKPVTPFSARIATYAGSKVAFPSALRIQPVSARWDRNRVLFEIVEGGEAYECAVSREALQDISSRRYAKPVELLACFEKVRPRLERLARDKLLTRSDAIEGLVTIWTGDLDEPEPPDGG
jgi:Protein of unknown function (DUF1488)